MAKRNGRDWEALRDEWVDRRLRGEALDRKDFAKEKRVPYDTLRRHAGTWQDHLDRREEEVQVLVRDRTTIDHATMRIAILEEREPLREFFMDQWERWKAAMKEDKDERVELREMIQLGNLMVKMAEVGAGLPKEHVVRHDEVHDTVATNRREMKHLEGTVIELCQWRKDNRERKKREARKTKA